MSKAKITDPKIPQSSDIADEDLIVFVDKSDVSTQPTGKTKKITPRDLFLKKFIPVNIRDYGAIGDGVADDTEAFLTAIEENEVITLPGYNNEIYNVDYTELEGVSKAIIGLGRPTLRMTNKNGMLSLKGGWESVSPVDANSFAVSAVNTVEPGESANNTYVSTFTVNANLILKRGQRVKIISDDVLENGSVAQYTGRKGEYAVIAKDVEGSGGTTLVTLTARLQDTYETNVRFAVAKETFYILENLIIDANPDLDMENAYSAAVEILGGQNSLIRDVLIKNVQGRGVFNAAFATRFDNLVVENLNDRPTKSQYGYGIDDSGTGTIVTGLKGFNTRHAYATNTFAILAETNQIERYGRPRDCLISDSFAFGNQSAGFDTHEVSDNIRFNNCHAINGYRGADSGGNGFTARGANIEFNGCTAKKCSSGFVLSVTKNVWMRNCQTLDISDIAVSVEGRTSYNGLVNYTGYKIENCYLEFGAATGSTVEQGILIGSSGYTFDIEINNTTIKMLGSAPNSKAIPMNGANLRINNLIIDLSEHTGTGVASLYLRDSLCNIYGRNIRVIGGSSASAVVINAAVSNSSPIFIKDLYYTHASVAPAFMVSTNLTAVRLSYIQDIGGTKTSSAYFLQTAAAGAILLTDKSCDPVINVRLNGSAGNVALGTIPNGHFPGQILNILNNSNGTVSCATPDFSLPSQSSLGVTLLWDGSWKVVGSPNRTINPSKGLTLANGVNNNIALTNPRSFYRITGPSAGFSIGGFNLWTDGFILRLFNATSQPMTILNEAATTTDVNRITTLTGADVVLRTGTSFATFIYDSQTSRWILVNMN